MESDGDENGNRSLLDASVVASMMALLPTSG